MAENSKIVLSGDKANEQIEIDPSVLEVIMGIAAEKVDGVAHMRGNVKSGINRVLGREDRSRGVNVSVDQDNLLTADVYVDVEAGRYVPEIAVNLQKVLKEQVKQMTDLTFKEVIVHVVGLVFPVDDAAENDAADSELFSESSEERKNESTRES